MKWIFSSVLVLLTWSLVLALQAIHVPDPVETVPESSQESPIQTQPPPEVNLNPPNATFFLSVVPVQEPIRDNKSTENSNSPWGDKSQQKRGSVPSLAGGGGGEAGEAEEEEEEGYKNHDQAEDATQKPGHDHFSGLVVNNQKRPDSIPGLVAGLPEESNSSTLRSITASSSLIVDNDGHQQHHHHDNRHELQVQRERGKELFVPSPQLGQWSEEHDFKRLLAENDNVFYPMRSPPARSQHASIKSTSFIGGESPPPSGDFDKTKFLNELPGPKFLSHGNSNAANHLSIGALPSIPQHYPKFNVMRGQTGGEIPHYVQREPEKPFRFPGMNHRTQFETNPPPLPSPNHSPSTQWHMPPEDPSSDVRVQPLLHPNPASGTVKHSSGRSTSFIHSASQPDHPYTFDFGHDESPATTFGAGDYQHGKPPPLEFHELNEYEKFPTLEQQHPHRHQQVQHHQRHGHGGGPWKKIVHVLAAAIPLGLVISALTPHVVYVNPNDTSINFVKQTSTLQKPFPAPPLPHPAFITYYPRWRALVENGQQKELLGKDNATLTDFFTQLSNSLTEIPGVDLCEDRAFCEMARLGADKAASESHKLLWRIANGTSEGQIRKAGMKHIFRAIREGHCEKIKCKKS